MFDPYSDSNDVGFHLISPLVTNGLFHSYDLDESTVTYRAHPYDLDESTVTYRASRSEFSFLFHFPMKFV